MCPFLTTMACWWSTGQCVAASQQNERNYFLCASPINPKTWEAIHQRYFSLRRDGIRSLIISRRLIVKYITGRLCRDIVYLFTKLTCSRLAFKNCRLREIYYIITDKTIIPRFPHIKLIKIYYLNCALRV